MRGRGSGAGGCKDCKRILEVEVYSLLWPCGWRQFSRLKGTASSRARVDWLLGPAVGGRLARPLHMGAPVGARTSSFPESVVTGNIIELSTRPPPPSFNYCTQACDDSRGDPKKPKTYGRIRVRVDPRFRVWKGAYSIFTPVTSSARRHNSFNRLGIGHNADDSWRQNSWPLHPFLLHRRVTLPCRVAPCKVHGKR